MDTVTAVRAAVGHLPQEHDALSFFFYQHIDVVHARQQVGELSKFMVVRRKQGARADAVMQILDHRPRQAHAVVGAGPPPYLVEDDQAAVGRVVQNVGDLLHLHQECAAPCGNVVGGADSGEDTVDEPDARGGGGDKRPNVRQQGDERRLAQVGRLAGHVRAGDDQHSPLGPRHEQVVGHVPLAAQHTLDDRVPAGADVQHRFVGDLRPCVTACRGDLRQGGQDVDVGDGVGRAQQRPGVGSHAVPDIAKKRVFKLGDALFGPQDRRFALFHRFSNEPLCTDQRLLADVVSGHPVQIGLADFDVVSKDFIEADFQGFDPGAGPFIGFQAGDPGLAVSGGMPERVQFRAVAIANHAALLDDEGRLTDDGRVDERGHVFVRANLSPQALELTGCAVKSLGEFGEPAQRAGQGNEVSRVSRSVADPPDQALQIGHRS